MKHTKLPVINRSINAGPVWFSQNWTDCANTEHRSEYGLHRMYKSADFSPKFKCVISDVPFEDCTESRDNYLSFKQNYDNLFIRRQDMLQTSKLPMESNTIYNNEYQAKNTDKSVPIKHQLSQIDFAFNCKDTIPPKSSLYRNDYRLYDKDSARKVVKFDDNIINNQDAKTDYHENFNQKPFTRLYLPSPVYKKPKVPLNSETSYNTNFIKHPFSKLEIVQPVKSNIAMSNSPFTRQSLYKTDFVEKERDDGWKELNVYQNTSSLTHKIPIGNWYDNYPSQKYANFGSNSIFEKRP